VPTPFDILADNIVNPRCDECGVSVEPRNPDIGPHLCWVCTARFTQENNKRFRDYLSQERPDRRVHVVKLPPDFDRK
jgi:predicted amidophosphoribosyltransferase